MSRIFKFSKFALKLFVSHASKLTDMKIYIYTDNFDIAYVATSGFKINVNEVGLVIPQNAVSNMTDGVINYRIEGYLNGDLYIEQRQSNYYLKTPSFEMQDTNIVAVSTEFVDGGDYKMIIKASEYNADGLSQVEIDATTFAGEMFEVGRADQKAMLEPITITENGTYKNENGYSTIEVNVEGGDCPVLEEVTITENGTYEGAYDKVIVDVPQEGGDCPELEDVTITANGEYEGAFGKVVVDVPQEGGGCNLEPLRVYANWEDRDGSGFVNYQPSEGMDGFDSVHINLFDAYLHGKEESKQEVINGLGHLVATEQKTYTAEKRIETRKYIHFDGDDYFYNEYQSTAGLTEINLEFRYEEVQPETYLLGNETYYIKLDFGELSALRGGYYTNPISIPSSTWINTKFDENGLSVTYDGNTITEPWIEGEERYPLLGGLIIGNNSLIHLHTRFYGDISTIEIHDSSNIEVYKPFLNGLAQGSFATLDGNMYENQGDGSAPYREESYEVGVDGWKSVEVNVDAGEIVAQTARVLDITENGTYKSQYSEPTYPDVITGVFPNGENFYSYAQLTNKVFNTGIKLTENTKIEVWYKPKETGLNQDGGIVGTIEANTTNGFSILTNKTMGSISGRIVRTSRHYRVFKPNWVHIELSFADGFVVDGKNYGTYTQNTHNFEKFICINKYINSADGYFGMIKIDDTIIIPTANGFLNTNTGRLLEVEAEGDYVFTEELPIYSEGNLIKTINVNVQPNLIPFDKTITKNGTYLFAKQEGMDGYSSGQVVVDVPQEGGGCEEAYEQGKTDQKVLMTTATFTSNGTYTREDGWNEVKVNVFWFSPFMEKTILYKFQQEWDSYEAKGYEWADKMSEYEQNNPNVTSNGMMYEIDFYGSEYFYNWEILNLSGEDISIWGKKSLVTPWVYNANNSPSTTKVLPDYFLGGFDCTEVEYINRVFEGAETLKAFLSLKNLGKSFTSVNTLDLSVLTNLNKNYYDGDCFEIIADSVYDFNVMNVNGISYSNVKLPSNVSQTAIDAWTAKGWVVMQ